MIATLEHGAVAAICYGTVERMCYLLVLFNWIFFYQLHVEW